MYEKELFINGCTRYKNDKSIRWFRYCKTKTRKQWKYIKEESEMFLFQNMSKLLIKNNHTDHQILKERAKPVNGQGWLCM